MLCLALGHMVTRRPREEPPPTVATIVAPQTLRTGRKRSRDSFQQETRCQAQTERRKE
jgi:hypothetical protein